jgi:hypothetical protein
MQNNRIITRLIPQWVKALLYAAQRPQLNYGIKETENHLKNGGMEQLVDF